MAVKLRLARYGAKKNPFYRVVAADSRYSRDGRYIETVGVYDPMKEPPVLDLKMERIEYWLGQGAAPSTTVEKLIQKARMNTVEEVR
ncbi:MAG: 30S ribosomal protein S16 [Bradymonadales bacterium]|nr:30S ribosomal protein S16 [Bradymonadales bacterium]